MPNKSSKKGHIPIRSCIICKRKGEQEKMLRFVLVSHSIVFDTQRKLCWRGSYCCPEADCLKKLRNHKKLSHRCKSWN